mmetsp:Transcript_38850/g.85378  ORF Transcript_38850/g.85378 Transcript_38850/m.85378 type:complete len:134 (-) Transcript_38850:830-1231(-)
MTKLVLYAGEPEVAKRVLELLRAGAVDCAGDEKRPWDHGVFVPMMLLFPKADVPVVQLSIRSDQDAAAHLKMGQEGRKTPPLESSFSAVGLAHPDTFCPLAAVFDANAFVLCTRYESVQWRAVLRSNCDSSAP